MRENKMVETIRNNLILAFIIDIYKYSMMTVT